jgi:putative transposase
MQRTLKLKLNPSPAQAVDLSQTLTEITRAFNFVCSYGWDNHEKNGVKLQHACYYALKKLCPGLVSDLLIQTIHKSKEAVTSVFALVKKYPAKVKAWEKKIAQAKAKGKVYRGKKPKPPSCPKSQNCPARYNLHTYKLAWARREVKLSTRPGNRLVVGFTVPPYYQKYLNLATDTADLIYRKGTFWLHVVVTLPAPDYVDSGDVVGVDLGLNHPAVTSKPKFLGSPRWKEVIQSGFRLKRKLQAKTTKSAKRHLRKLSGKVQRFRKDCDHVLSKRIVQSCTSGTTIVIEALTEIRATTEQRGRESRRRLHSWSFAQLRSFLSYKAQAAGIKVVAIDPRHTSQTCSKCGFQSRSNRKSQALFLCKRCGYQLNADLNASYNIRAKHLATLSRSLGSGLPSISLSSQPQG